MNHTRFAAHWVVLLTMLAAPASLSDCCGSAMDAYNASGLDHFALWGGTNYVHRTY